MWINTRRELLPTNVSGYNPTFGSLLNNDRNGGDTEVDVNDVGALLEPIIIQRKAEKTWEIDEFGRIAALAREPDEVSAGHFEHRYSLEILLGRGSLLGSLSKHEQQI